MLVSLDPLIDLITKTCKKNNHQQTWSGNKKTDILLSPNAYILPVLYQQDICISIPVQHAAQITGQLSYKGHTKKPISGKKSLKKSLESRQKNGPKAEKGKDRSNRTRLLITREQIIIIILFKAYSPVNRTVTSGIFTSSNLTQVT